MARLCGRPGCSEPGAAAYGMFPEDLLFWIAPLEDLPEGEHNVLCRRHADAMVVPRGWTLDDRREPIPRLFMPRPEPAPETGSSRRPSRRRQQQPEIEQLQIDGTGEIELRLHDESVEPSPQGQAAEGTPSEHDAAPWRPEFDQDDDLGGLLEVTSPLLSRAFRGTDRPRG